MVNRPPVQPRIGLLVQRLDPTHAYHRRLWITAYDLARERHCGLLMIAGQSPDGPDPSDVAHTAVYHLLGTDLFDGALVSQTVTSRMAPERLAQFAAELPTFPLVTTTIPLGARPCYRVANEPGLRALMRHLIEVHGCRRIVHVRGPHPNREAEIREAVWREELERAGITPEASWLVQGHYDIERLGTIGYEVVEQTHGEFDAVVTCNDLAALRVMEDLQTQGYKLPEDALVCGFDDIPSAQLSTPSLTTVRQPIEAQTLAAWNGLEELRLARNHPASLTLDTTLVVRASCSCGSEHWTPGAFSVLDEGPQDRQALMSLHENRLQHVTSMVYGLHNFVRALNRVGEVEDLPQILQEGLPRLGVGTFAVFQTCTAAGVAREHLCTWDPRRVLPSAPEFFRLLTARPNQGINADEVFPGEGFAPKAWLDALGSSILGMFPLVLGNVWFGVAFFELPRNAGVLERALQEQLASVFDRLSREKSFRETSTEAKVRERVQAENMATLRRLVAEVAHEVNSPLGAIVSSNSSVGARLADLEDDWLNRVAPPLAPSRRVLEGLIQSMRASTGIDFPVEDRKRRAFLRQTLETLNVPDSEQGAEILISLNFEGGEEDLASLASNPEFRRGLTILGLLADLRVSTKIIDLAAEKIGNFVAMLRTTTRARSNAELLSVDLKESLEMTLLLLKGELQQGLTVDWEGSVVPRVLCRPDEIQQVWTNLLRNAFHAMGHQGRVVLRLSTEDDLVRVDVVDTGHGIDPANRDRIFTPFFSTKPEGEGLGLGLDITKKIVDSMGGRIAFESVPGLTTFSVWLRSESFSTLPSQVFEAS